MFQSLKHQRAPRSKKLAARAGAPGKKSSVRNRPKGTGVVAKQLRPGRRRLSCVYETVEGLRERGALAALSAHLVGARKLDEATLAAMRSRFPEQSRGLDAIERRWRGREGLCNASKLPELDGGVVLCALWDFYPDLLQGALSDLTAKVCVLGIVGRLAAYALSAFELDARGV